MKKIYFSMLIAAATLLAVSCQKNADKAPATSAVAQDQSARLVRVDDSKMTAPGAHLLKMRVEMTGNEEVPAHRIRTVGYAWLRLMDDGTLYSQVKIKGLAPGDALIAAHIHAAPAGVNGPVKIFLAHNAGDFGMTMMQTLDANQMDLLLNQPCYTNAHSNTFPGGIVRGQIR